MLFREKTQFIPTIAPRGPPRRAAIACPKISGPYSYLGCLHAIKIIISRLETNIKTLIIPIPLALSELRKANALQVKCYNPVYVPMVEYQYATRYLHLRGVVE
jgi:hypothetical protein